MKLNHRRTLAAAVLAGIAFSASAQNATPDATSASAPMGQDVVANSADACPRDTIPSTPSYGFQDGHLVQNGWVCESLYHKR